MRTPQVCQRLPREQQMTIEFWIPVVYLLEIHIAIAMERTMRLRGHHSVHHARITITRSMLLLDAHIQMELQVQLVVFELLIYANPFE
jgi:hypothetical protein